jgi:predicted phosphodiesterase
MRIAIVSDVHANLTALDAVLRHASAVDATWSLGDSVGYGPQPAECVARLRELEAVMVAGNHERAATGAISTEDFNPDAATAAQWTKTQLTAEERAFLDSLPEVATQGEFTLVHGTLRDPIWEYLYSYEAAIGHLALQDTPFGLFGHTHIPTLVVEGESLPRGCELFRLPDGERVGLGGRTGKLVLNPGSVGQPRDGDGRSSYALYDSEDNAITLHRVEYDIGATQKLMEEARLPRWLIERLSEGR